ncbi:MAG: DedA family protein [Candidatus Dormibacteria bacterium]
MLLASLTGFASGFVQHWGYLAVFLIAGLESLCLPFLPGETALLTAAVLAPKLHLAIAGVIAAAAAGPIVGGSISYAIGWWGGYHLLVRHGERFGAGQSRVKVAHYLFQRRGGAVVLLGRFVLVLRSFAGLFAGATRMSPLPFLAFNAAGSVIWATGYGLAAYTVGESVQNLSGWLTLGFGLVAVLVLAAAAWLLHRQSRGLEARAAAAYPDPLPGYPGGPPL